MQQLHPSVFLSVEAPEAVKVVEAPEPVEAAEAVEAAPQELQEINHSKSLSHRKQL